MLINSYLRSEAMKNISNPKFKESLKDCDRAV